MTHIALVRIVLQIDKNPPPPHLEKSTSLLRSRLNHAGGFLDLVFARSLGACKEPDATCKSRLDECAGTRRACMVACPNALAASVACQVTDKWFTPHFSIFVKLDIRQWVAEVSCACASQPIGPACWFNTLDKFSSSDI